MKDCIVDFEVMVTNEQDDSAKLHRDIVEGLEKKLKELEAKEVAQWEAQYDPELAMPPHIFKKLNEKLLKEKEEVQKSLCKTKESIPKPVNYKDKIVKFTDALDALENPNISAKIKNQYLKNVIERIEVYRGKSIRLSKENRDQYLTDTDENQMYYMGPYEIKIELKD